jgi:hypothetical protein
MLRKSFVRMMTVVVIGIRVDAQETIHRTASNANARLELCCGRKHVEMDGGKGGVFHKAAAGIFQGKVKQLNEKEIVIENDAKQMVLIRRSHQTKFLRNNQPINSSDIDLETPVTIDAREAANVSLVAIKVSVDSPPTTTDFEVDGPKNRQRNISLGVHSFTPKAIDAKRIPESEK